MPFLDWLGWMSVATDAVTKKEQMERHGQPSTGKEDFRNCDGFNCIGVDGFCIGDT